MILKLKKYIKDNKSSIINSFIMCIFAGLLIFISKYFGNETLDIGGLKLNTTNYLKWLSTWSAIFLFLVAILLLIKNEKMQEYVLIIFGFMTIFLLGILTDKDVGFVIFLGIMILVFLLWVLYNSLIKSFVSFLFGIVISVAITSILIFILEQCGFNSTINNKIYCLIFIIILNLYLKCFLTKFFIKSDYDRNKLHMKVFYLFFIILTFVLNVDIQYSTFLLIAYLIYDIEWNKVIDKNY